MLYLLGNKKDMNRQELINTLKELDGETLEHIIRTIGMEEQMLRQLIMNSPESDIKDLLEEKRLISDKHLSDNVLNDIVYLERGLA
jgi:hypothetical protein